MNLIGAAKSMNNKKSRYLVILIFFVFFAFNSAKADDQKLLENFLNYVKINSAGKKINNLSSIQPNYTDPFTDQALMPRLYKAISRPDLKDGFLNKIKSETKIVVDLLDKPINELRLVNLIKGFKLAIGTPEEVLLLEKILKVAYRKRALDTKNLLNIFQLYQQKAPILHFNPGLRLLNPIIIEGEEYAAFARKSQLNSKRLGRLYAFLKKHPLNSDALYSAACSLAIIGKHKKAASILARSYLLSPSFIKKLPQDKDLSNLATMPEIYSKLLKGKYRPEVKEADYPGIETVEMKYSWSGLGKGVKDSKKLIWKDGSFETAKEKIKIPANLISSVAKLAQKNLIKTSAPISQITHFDDYPSFALKFSIDRKANPLFLFSSSNTGLHLPINIFDGKNLYYSNNEMLGKALKMLGNWVNLKKGSPRAAYFTGNREISVPEQNQKPDHRFSSFFPELRFERANENSKFQNKAQEALNRIKKDSLWKIEKAMHTFIPGKDEKSIQWINRFFVTHIPSAGKHSSLLTSLIHTTQTNKQNWLLKSPEQQFALAKDIEKKLITIFNLQDLKISIMPLLRTPDKELYPTGKGLVLTIQSLIRHGKTMSALGNSTCAFKFDCKSTNDKISGTLFPGTQELAIKSLELKSSHAIFPLRDQLLDLVGFNTESKSEIVSLSLANNELRVFFNENIATHELNAIYELIKENGFNPIIEAGKTPVIKMFFAVADKLFYLSLANDMKLHLRSSY